MAPINKILGCYFILQFKEVLIVKFTLGRSPSEGKGYSLYYSGLENSMDCIVHGVAKSQTQLNDFHSLSQDVQVPGREVQEGGDICIPVAGSC